MVVFVTNFGYMIMLWGIHHRKYFSLAVIIFVLVERSVNQVMVQYLLIFQFLPASSGPTLMPHNFNGFTIFWNIVFKVIRNGSFPY